MELYNAQFYGDRNNIHWNPGTGQISVAQKTQIQGPLNQKLIDTHEKTKELYQLTDGSVLGDPAFEVHFMTAEKIMGYKMDAPLVQHPFVSNDLNFVLSRDVGRYAILGDEEQFYGTSVNANKRDMVTQSTDAINYEMELAMYLGTDSGKGSGNQFDNMTQLKPGYMGLKNPHFINLGEPVYPNQTGSNLAVNKDNTRETLTFKGPELDSFRQIFELQQRQQHERTSGGEALPEDLAATHRKQMLDLIMRGRDLQDTETTVESLSQAQRAFYDASMKRYETFMKLATQNNIDVLERFISPDEEGRVFDTAPKAPLIQPTPPIFQYGESYSGLAGPRLAQKMRENLKSVRTYSLTSATEPVKMDGFQPNFGPSGLNANSSANAVPMTDPLILGSGIGKRVSTTFFFLLLTPCRWFLHQSPSRRT